jgi:hypothetical protein
MKEKVIVQLTGGLGNQLFQYAVARAISLRNNMDLKVDINFFKTYKWHDYSLNPFNILKDYISEVDINKSVYNHSLYKKMLVKLGFKINWDESIYQERSLDYDDKVLGIKKTTYLKGYWQSEKYFEEIADVIRKDFRITIEPSPLNDAVLKDINSVNAVALHVRRGNFVSEPDLLSFHGTCSLEYYQKAVEYMNERVENPVYFLFSNDITWCKESLNLDININYVDINSDKTDYEDLRLMMNCKHQIIANSTFSWWGAWLNENPDKIVIAPKQWFADEAMNGQTSDLIPEDWIRM